MSRSRKTKSRRCGVTGKQAWASEHDALSVISAHSAMKRTASGKYEKRAYKCQYGKHWHTTSQEHHG